MGIFIFASWVLLKRPNHILPVGSYVIEWIVSRCDNYQGTMNDGRIVPIPQPPSTSDGFKLLLNYPPIRHYSR